MWIIVIISSQQDKSWCTYLTYQCTMKWKAMLLKTWFLMWQSTQVWPHCCYWYKLLLSEDVYKHSVILFL